MRATEKRAASLDPVADDPAPAVIALGRQHVNGAFEAIEIMRDAVHHDLDGFVIFVAATFARRAAMPIAFAERGLLHLPVVFEIAPRMSLNHIAT
jgi:hypothetical protein